MDSVLIEKMLADGKMDSALITETEDGYITLSGKHLPSEFTQEMYKLADKPVDLHYGTLYFPIKSDKFQNVKNLLDNYEIFYKVIYSLKSVLPRTVGRLEIIKTPIKGSKNIEPVKPDKSTDISVRENKETEDVTMTATPIGINTG